jgi:hypothetical protein
MMIAKQEGALKTVDTSVHEADKSLWAKLEISEGPGVGFRKVT